MASKEFYEMLAPWTSNAPNRPETIDATLLKSWMGGVSESAPGTATIHPTDAAGVPAEWVCGRDTSPDLRLLYLHGGGYISGSAAGYRDFTAVLSNATGCDVLAADYRVGPEHPFPAAVEDAVTAYLWMRDHDRNGRPARAATHTFIAGDSAGGGLTLAALLALRDARQPLPAGAVTISAYTDLAHTGDSMRTRVDVDPVARPAWMPTYADNYLCGADPRHPLASPLYGDPTGLPPLLIQVGDAELIRDDSTRFAAKAQAAGVNVTLEVWPEMIHVWHIRKPDFPEAREAVDHIRRFVRALV
jgi:epsilon-lactone hydrolase